LHAVDIEIENAPDKWVRIGPKRDAAASSVFELASGQRVSRDVSVYDLSDAELNLLKDTRPKYRAVLRYFESREAWLSFASSIGHKSKPITIIGRAD
jgi:uncharacterized protein YqiB (DUF1249 family)